MSQYQRMNNDGGYHAPDNEEITVRLKGWEKVVYNSVFHFVLLLCLCAVIGIGLPILWGEIWKPSMDRGIEGDLRTTCWPLKHSWMQMGAKNCSRDICIFDNFSVPVECYYAQEKETDFLKNDSGFLPRYAVIKSEHYDSTPNSPGKKHTLEILNSAPFLDIKNTNINEAPVVVKRLTVEVCHYTTDHFSIQIRPEDDDDPKRWSHYMDFKYPPDSDCTAENAKKSLAEVSVLVDSKKSSLNPKTFQLRVTRKTTGKSIFDMGQQSPFIYANGYMEITTNLINDYVWGLGQSYSDQFRLNFSKPRSWNLLSQYNDKDLNENSTNMWGSHPFYLGVDDPTTGDAYGILLVNSHPIQIDTNARPSLSYKTFGGNLEFVSFLYLLYKILY